MSCETKNVADEFEDAELQTLLDEDGNQTREMIAEQLILVQKTISICLKAKGLL